MQLVISLRVLLIIMVVVIAITAGLIAFFPLYFAAQAAATDTANDFADTITSGIAARVGPFFFSAQSALDAILHAVTYGDVLPQSNSSMWNWLTYGFISSGFSCSAYYDNGVWLSVQRTSTLTNITAVDPNVMTTYGSVSTQLLQVDIRPQTNLSVVFSTKTQGTNYVPSSRPFWNGIRNSRTWTAPFVDTAGKQAILVAGCPLVVPRGDTVVAIGALSLRVESMDVLTYLQQLRVSDTGRVILVETSQNQFIGGNFLESPVNNGSLKSAKSVEEPLIREMVEELGDVLWTCVPPCRLTYGSGRNIRFVRVAEVADDYALNLRVIVVIPASDFLENIWKGSEIGIGASFGSVAALAFVVVLCLRMILKPLTSLQPRLRQCAMLGDFPSEISGPWALEEVLAIENACTRLAQDLKKVKSFLPQSVVDQLDAQQSTAIGLSRGADASHVHGSKSGGGGSLSNDDDDDALDSLSDHSVSFSDAAAMTVTNSIVVVRDEDSQGLTQGGHGQAHTTQYQPHSQHLPCYRKVTVAFVDLLGTYRCLETCGAESVVSQLDQATSVILELAKANKGVVDWICGDRFIISFNASAPCPSHATKAAAVTMSLARNPAFAPRLSDEADQRCSRFVGVAIGVASSQALCGYFGCREMKRFGIIGHCMNHASLLMDVAKRVSVSNLVSPSTRESVKCEYETMHASIESLPFVEQPALLSTLVGECSDAWPSVFGRSCEQLEDLAQDRAVVAKVNTAFEKIAAGDLSAAAQIIAHASKKHPGHTGVERAAHSLKTRSSEAQ